ncbi:DUF3060 domain-containing protein [Caulobacter sp. 73W]|uniref:DUF3060 domain-containing protein n=1 Tax=Caulobacter sp. 73W TaxID=3161137 RepID=A0AB39KVL1_9CAUL
MIALALALAAQVGTASVASGEPIRIAGVEQQRTIACEGRDVFVAGVDHQLTFTGACASLTLVGTDNTIIIGLKPGALVKVEGTGHNVRWKSDREPQVRVVGVDNQIERQVR